MKNNRISTVLAGLILVVPAGAGAVYPAYQPKNAQGQMVYVPNNTMTPAANSLGYQVSGTLPANQVVIANTAVAAQPSRVTGALPRVGSNATAAGRQYYQPADFDRLADSGLYIGLSAAYAVSVMGGMNADYKGEDKGAFVPGAWSQANWQSDAVIPLQISVGASINSDVRVDFSYTRYSGIAYPDTVTISDGGDGTWSAPVSGGAVTANATMLNLYYNIDSYTGYIAGGTLRPYIGAGIGLSLNTIADYVIYDEHFYEEYSYDDVIGGGLPAGTLTAVSDVYGYHNGGTSENLAFMLEAGVTTDMGGGLKLDFFARYANLGKVKNSGSIILSQIEWMSDGLGGEYEAPYDAVYHYTNWYESGRLSMIDVGVRLRLQF